VIDNGGGVSRLEAHTVFEKFSRGKRESLDQGAGLGLPISRTLMQAMGGNLLVKFRDDGSSFFRVVLNVAAVASDSGSDAEDIRAAAG